MSHDPYAALRVAAFRWFLFSISLTTLATQIQGVAVAWQVYDVTRNPLNLGLVGLAEALPFIAVALFAGHVADRTDRRKVALWALGALLACAGLLLYLTVSLDPSPRRLTMIYLVLGLSGVGRAFLRPSQSALAAELVPRSLYGNAATWRSSVWQTAAVVGPAVGGVLYGVTSAAICYAVVVGLMTCSILFLALVRPAFAAPPLDAGAEAESIWTSLAGGLRFVWRQPAVLGALTLDLFAVLFGGAVALLPVFADTILHVGPSGLGVLRAAPAVGAVVMGVAMAYRPPLRRAGRAMLVAVALFGVSTVVFGISRSFSLSLAMLALGGMVDQVSVVIRSTLVQTLTPPALLGRVSAVNSIFIGSSNEIGAFESGVTAKLFGTVPAVVFGGVMTVVVVAVVWATNPTLRALGRIEDEPATS